jgi:hypothetical protein
MTTEAERRFNELDAELKRVYGPFDPSQYVSRPGDGQVRIAFQDGVAIGYHEGVVWAIEWLNRCRLDDSERLKLCAELAGERSLFPTIIRRACSDDGIVARNDGSIDGYRRLVVMMDDNASSIITMFSEMRILRGWLYHRINGHQNH